MSRVGKLRSWGESERMEERDGKNLSFKESIINSLVQKHLMTVQSFGMRGKRGQETGICVCANGRVYVWLLVCGAGLPGRSIPTVTDQEPERTS